MEKQLIGYDFSDLKKNLLRMVFLYARMYLKKNSFLKFYLR